jgi:hypothetical protein
MFLCAEGAMSKAPRDRVPAPLQGASPGGLTGGVGASTEHILSHPGNKVQKERLKGSVTCAVFASFDVFTFWMYHLA